MSAQEPLLDRHKNIYTIYSLCPFENTNRDVSFSMLRERVVSFDFSRILKLCRRGIFSAYIFWPDLTLVEPNEFVLDWIIYKSIT